jgi:chromosome segregation and condensation protein ScpB
VEKERIESILESLLFVAGEPLSLKRLHELAREVPRREILAALESGIR